MFLLYIFCLLPILVGLILVFVTNGEVSWKEWLIGAGCSFIVAGSIHYYSFHSQVGDYETWSGKITQAVFVPKWHEYYEEAIYKTEYYYSGTGKNRTRHSRQVFSHWSPRSRWHSASWIAYSNINTSYDITQQKYEYFVKKFGNELKERGDRTTMEHNSRMISGDPYDYKTYLKDGFVEPITDVRYFENRIKATPSVFNFVKVGDNIPIFPYPENKNPWISNRVMGITFKTISTRLWDEMCARVGPIKRVNVIIVGFDSRETMMAEWQKAKWLGGKKNDLVLTYGPKWAKVFGWSESDICKKNIESILLQNTINNDIIPLIEKEIYDNYKKREFTEDFAYLQVEPSSKSWILFIFLMIITQALLYVGFHHTDL